MTAADVDIIAAGQLSQVEPAGRTSRKPTDDTRLPLAPQDLTAEVLRRERTYRNSLLSADVLATLAALALTATIAKLHFTIVALATPLMVVVIGKVKGLYDRDDMVLRKSTMTEWRSVVAAAGMAATAEYLLWGPLTTGPTDAGIATFALLWSSLGLLSITARATARRFARRITPPERCLIVGRDDSSTDLASRIAAVDGIDLIGAVSADELDGSLTDLAAVVERLSVHRLIIGADASTEHAALELIRRAKWLGVRVSLFPGALASVGGEATFDHLDGITLLGVPRFGLSPTSRALKRAFDLAGATLGLLVTAPATLLIAALIKLDSPGPALFRQTRIGRDGRPFSMLKFRSMVANADAMKKDLLDRNEAASGLFKLTDDPRVTRIGRWLRRTHLDELPQLWNVIRGEMSLVGPRPLIEEEDRLLSGSDRFRLYLTPGVTGPWQVKGPLTTPLSEMARLDYLYVSNWSPWVDCQILLRTILRVLRQGGH